MERQDAVHDVVRAYVHFFPEEKKTGDRLLKAEAVVSRRIAVRQPAPR